MLDEQDAEHMFYLLFPHARFHLFHSYALFLFLLPFNPAPQIPIPLIPLQIPVSSGAEGVIRRALGVPLPVAPGLRIPDSRGTGSDGFFHILPTVAIGAKP